MLYDTAAMAEGFCPVHRAPLEAGVIRLGGKGGLPERRQPAGWCAACGCWWHLSPAGSLIATWAACGGKAAAAGDAAEPTAGLAWAGAPLGLGGHHRRRLARLAGLDGGRDLALVGRGAARPVVRGGARVPAGLRSCPG